MFCRADSCNQHFAKFDHLIILIKLATSITSRVHKTSKPITADSKTQCMLRTTICTNMQAKYETLLNRMNTMR